jgi:hypothetical protein
MPDGNQKVIGNRNRFVPEACLVHQSHDQHVSVFMMDRIQVNVFKYGGICLPAHLQIMKRSGIPKLPLILLR